MPHTGPQRVRLLIIHSTPELLTSLRRGLRAQRYEVRTAADSYSALDLTRSWTPDVVLMEFAGHSAAFRQFQQRLRSVAGVQLIAMLCNRPGQLRMDALAAGADDYLACPVTIPELTARIALATERASARKSEVLRRIHTPDLQIDLEHRTVVVAGQERHFAPKEFELLRCLLLHANRPVQHSELLTAIGSPATAAGRNALRVYVRQLRKKLESDAGRPRYIRTEARIGYRFQAGSSPTTIS